MTQRTKDEVAEVADEKAKKSAGRKEMVSARVDENLVDAFLRYARSHGWSKTQAIEKAMLALIYGVRE